MTDVAPWMIEANGERLGVRRAGAGPAVVLLHGLGGAAAEWDASAAALGPGFATIAIDLRGHGASSANGSFSVAGCVADVIAAADAQGLDAFHLVGAGVGAVIAGRLAALAPERVRSLALVAARLAPGPEAADEVYAVREALHYLKPDDFGLQIAETMLRPEAAPELLADVVRRIASVPKAVYMKGVEQAAVIGLADDAAKIAAPTLVVAGGRDERAPPAEGERLARAIAGARIAVIGESGPLIAVEQPAALALALRAFLDPLVLAAPRRPR